MDKEVVVLISAFIIILKWTGVLRGLLASLTARKTSHLHCKEYVTDQPVFHDPQITSAQRTQLNNHGLSPPLKLNFNLM